jgi:alkyl hydroperoxide reductase subunit AhpC
MHSTVKATGRKVIHALIVGVLFGLTAAVSASPGVFKDFEGQPRSIDDYTGDGRWLMVMIWVHDCHVCNMEIEAYAQFHIEHQQNDANVLGLSMDGEANKADALAFIERHDVPFPSLIGELRDVAAHFQALTGTAFRGTPSILLYDPQGELRAAQGGAVPVTAIEAFIAQQPAP